MIESFAAAVTEKCHTLILGSIPGVKSLQEQQYYAHPRNAFWPIMQALYAVDNSLEYKQRLTALNTAGVALWDVLQRCERGGSLDSAIEKSSIAPNAIPALLEQYPNIQTIGLNGGTAHKTFCQHFPEIIAERSEYQVVQLPSSSPAYAAMPYADKLLAWRSALLS